MLCIQPRCHVEPVLWKVFPISTSQFILFFSIMGPAIRAVQCTKAQTHTETTEMIKQVETRNLGWALGFFCVYEIRYEYSLVVVPAILARKDGPYVYN